jgi:hypothetical protein
MMELGAECLWRDRLPSREEPIFAGQGSTKVGAVLPRQHGGQEVVGSNPASPTVRNALNAIQIHGERLPAFVLALAGVEAPLPQ